MVNVAFIGGCVFLASAVFIGAVGWQTRCLCGVDAVLVGDLDERLTWLFAG